MRVERQSVLPGSFKRKAIVLVHDLYLMIVLNVRNAFIHSKDAVGLARNTRWLDNLSIISQKLVAILLLHTTKILRIPAIDAS